MWAFIVWVMTVFPASAASSPVSLLVFTTSPLRSATAMAIREAFESPAIRVTITNELSVFNAETSKNYDCILIHSGPPRLAAPEENVLIDFVDRGGGLAVVGQGSAAFANSSLYESLVGGRLRAGAGGPAVTRVLDSAHWAMQGVRGFESPEPPGRRDRSVEPAQVLMAWESRDGFEPYAWATRHGSGRIFSVATGDAAESWRQKEFRILMDSAVRWLARKNVDELGTLNYVKARVPRYVEAAAWGISEVQDSMQAPLSPEDSMKRMHLPEGLSVQLFASEPDVVKPIAMTWDERGRLWLVESIDYPNQILESPERNGHDRIKICEDTDGDGRADKFTIFADHLNLPTGIVLVDGGAIVAAAPHLLFLRDRDGDGVADERRVLYTGFGRNDTHAVVSNLRYGLDNWIYGSIGYSGGNVRVGRVTHVLRAGLFRFRSDGSALEVLAGTSNNTWGLGQSEDGDIFSSTANNEHAVHLAIPNRYFEAVRGWHGQGCVGIDDHKRVHPVTSDVRQVDFFGGYTAAAGYEIYTARNLPKLYWGAGLVCEPTAHLVHCDFLKQRGSEFIARDGYNLLASEDAWTAPVAARVGPDGAVWVLDWYNYIIQHNPTPNGFENGPGNAYVTDLRDTARGRIYRIMGAKSASGSGKNLSLTNSAELIATLGDENFFWRLTAQRLLIEGGGKHVFPELLSLVMTDFHARGPQHALYALEGLGAFTNESPEIEAALKKALASREVSTRRAALSVLPRLPTSARLILEAGLLNDEASLVRKDALLALAEITGNDEVGSAVAAFLANPKNAADRWLSLAAISTAARNDRSFLHAAARLRPTDENRNVLARAVRIFAEHYGRGAPVDSIASVIEAYQSGPAELLEPLVAGLAAGWPVGPTPPMTQRFEEDLSHVRRDLSLSGQLQLASLANRWGVGDKFQADLAEARERMLKRVDSEADSDEARVQAARELMAMASDGNVAKRLLAAVTPRSSLELARGLIEALGQSSLAEAGAVLVEGWDGLTPRARQTALHVLLSRPDWSQFVLDAIEANRISISELSLDQTQRLLTHSNALLKQRATELFAQGGRVPDQDREKVVARLLPLAKRRGDVDLGRNTFQKNCASCHRFGGEGGILGPDLSALGENREEILMSILDPNRSVEGNFRQFTIETALGQTFAGIVANETRTTVELIDAQSERRVFPRSEILRITSSPRSLMPEGFEALSEEELVSLLDFLAPPARFQPVSLVRVANVSTLDGIPFDNASSERMILDSWAPRVIHGVPFHFINRDSIAPNAVILYAPATRTTQEWPRKVGLRIGQPVKTIHLLSGISGWGYPASPKGSVSLIVRVHYTDGSAEDHELINGTHFADYIRRVDVPGSEHALDFQDGRQIRHVMVTPSKTATIESIELVKGPDGSAPIIMALTLESP
jgi:putative membrane-bound dehydrogenase-like protein